MLSQFQASYQRLEQSLQRLTDSIAAYNVSPRAADELLAADDAVNDNLEQLITHQANHARLQHLRRTAAALDDTLQTSIRALADTRRDILAIPAAGPTATAEAEDGQTAPREIGVDDLLNYAKFISRTTVPPTFRQQDLPPLPAGVSRAATAASESVAANGAANGAPSSSPPQQRAPEANGDAGDEPHQQQQQETQAWLNQELPFDPWPSQAHMQMGVLGDIQRLLESGKDPASVLTAEEQVEADRRKREEEERERAAQEEAERRRASMFDTSAVRRRETVGDVFNPDDL